MGLMDQMQPRRGSNLGAILSMAKGNPQALMGQLMRTNPNFAAFVERNKGKTPEQAFRDNGLDFNEYRNLF